ncbi:DUF4177 domain-containing protein [Croceivirga thetidis]|uniref:DUF4177 domain-containing protein n=1 Tax=Croceivirga thetidis TaxID=2721623 RepID=A0ABX1GV02_9FLAO|nr:DUF4177 domain-containing protein [Croceivirga thetidis]NKI33449.1 DUF4177 domain-containing protein [Croceivirga thetidis]
MKEYKVVSWKMSLTGNSKRLEDTLNEYAKQGWRLVHVYENTASVIFERDKNR